MKILAYWFSVLALAAVSPLVGAIDTKCKSVPPFTEVDRDKSGYINRPEARAVHRLAGLFKILDSDRNGTIDRKEYRPLSPCAPQIKHEPKAPGVENGAESGETSGGGVARGLRSRERYRRQR